MTQTLENLHISILHQTQTIQHTTLNSVMEVMQMHLKKYDAGDYAYWLASGISTEYDEKMVDDCIQLFCEENLSEQ